MMRSRYARDLGILWFVTLYLLLLHATNDLLAASVGINYDVQTATRRNDGVRYVLSGPQNITPEEDIPSEGASCGRVEFAGRVIFGIGCCYRTSMLITC